MECHDSNGDCRSSVEQAAVLTTPPVTRGYDGRRASLLIKDTEQLLTGLHREADRSEALMAELEALLLAAQRASRHHQRQPSDMTTATSTLIESITEPTSTSATTSGMHGAQGSHFQVVEPLQVEDSESDTESVIEEEQVITQGPQACALRPCISARRFPVVTLDGNKLMGTGPGGAAAGASGYQPHGGPPGYTPNRGALQPTLSYRARPSGLVAAKSFTDSSRNCSTRTSIAMDGGGDGGGRALSGIQQQILQMPQLNGYGGGGGGGSRSSRWLTHTGSTDSGSVAPQPLSQPHRSVVLSPVGTDVRSSGDGDGGGGWEGVSAGGERSLYGSAVGLGSSGVASAVGSPVTAVDSPVPVGKRGLGDGRLMKILRGIFQPSSKQEEDTRGISTPADRLPCGSPVNTTPDCRSPTPKCTPTSNSNPRSSTSCEVDSTLAQGTLTGMAFPSPLRSQRNRKSFTASGSYNSVTTNSRRALSGPQRSIAGLARPSSPPQLPPLAQGLVGRSSSISAVQHNGSSFRPPVLRLPSEPQVSYDGDSEQHPCEPWSSVAATPSPSMRSFSHQTSLNPAFPGAFPGASSHFVTTPPTQSDSYNPLELRPSRRRLTLMQFQT